MRIATVLWDRKPTLAAIIGDSALNLPACAGALKGPDGGGDCCPWICRG